MGKKIAKAEASEEEIERTLTKITEMVETMEEIYFKNMNWLQEFDNKLYKKLKKVSDKVMKDKGKEKCAVELNKTAALDIIIKKDKTFIYNCEPFIYGDEKVREVKGNKKMSFIGTGLGTHITSILREFKPKRVVINEENIQYFRCSLYVTDYETLSKISKIKFSINSKPKILEASEVVRFDKY